MSKKGYVYVLQNPDFPHLLKIGRTTRTPGIRARELSAHTAIPQCFEVIYYRHFDDCFVAENDIHAILHQWRAPSNKEYFELDPAQAIEAIRNYRPVRKRKREKAGLFVIRPPLVALTLVLALIVLSNTVSLFKKDRKVPRLSLEHFENMEDDPPE